MTNIAKSNKRKGDIYGKYRRISRKPDLTNKEIEEMRRHLSLLAQTIREYIWKKKFY